MRISRPRPGSGKQKRLAGASMPRRARRKSPSRGAYDILARITSAPELRRSAANWPGIAVGNMADVGVRGEYRHSEY